MQSYNDMSSSLQHRILPTLRKFEDLEITSSLHRVEDPSPIHNPAISFLPGCEEDDIASEDRLFQEDKL